MASEVIENWQKNVKILGGIYISRLLGMFLLFPVFSLYASSLANSSSQLIGIALGAYGLTQGLLQIPYGYLSDKYGRKPLIIIGLSLFLLGSIWAVLTNDIYGMIGARLLQGMGAVSAVTLACIVDTTPAEKLGKSMAVIGASIGISFLVSLVIAPPISAYFGEKSLFYMIIFLAGSALISAFYLPAKNINFLNCEKIKLNIYDKKSVFLACLLMFILHFLFTGSFVILPHLFKENSIAVNQLWLIYFPANLLALFAIRKQNKAPNLLRFAIDFLVFTGALFLFAIAKNMISFIIAAILFFIAFYRLEVSLPHFLAENVSQESRGKLMSYFTSSQFIASFIGGTLAGLLWENLQLSKVFIILGMISGISAFSLFLYWKKL